MFIGNITHFILLEEDYSLFKMGIRAPFWVWDLSFEQWGVTVGPGQVSKETG